MSTLGGEAKLCDFNGLCVGVRGLSTKAAQASTDLRLRILSPSIPSGGIVTGRNTFGRRCLGEVFLPEPRRVFG